MGRRAISAIRGGGGVAEIQAFLAHAKQLPPAEPGDNVRHEALGQVDELEREAMHILTTLEDGRQVPDTELKTFETGIEDLATASSRTILPMPDAIVSDDIA